MKKLILLLLLGLLNSFNINKTIIEQITKMEFKFDTMTAKELYNYFGGFLYGLTKFNEKNETKCFDAYKNENNTKIFLDSISIVLDSIRKDGTFEGVISDIGLNIIVVNGFARYCNLLDAIPFYKKVSGLKKLEDLLGEYKIPEKFLSLDLSDDIYSFYSTANYTEKFVYIGKIFSFLFNFSVR